MLGPIAYVRRSFFALELMRPQLALSALISFFLIGLAIFSSDSVLMGVAIGHIRRSHFQLLNYFGGRDLFFLSKVFCTPSMGFN